jgi:hypothetical protein
MTPMTPMLLVYTIKLMELVGSKMPPCEALSHLTKVK